MALLACWELLPGIERSLPPNSLPWRPVRLDAPPGWLAHWQMYRLKNDANRCRAALARAGQRFTPIADRRVDGDCGYRDAVRLESPPIRFSGSVNAACGLAAGLVWYQALLKQAAREQMHSPLVRIDHVGVFACRNVNSEAGGSRSQHAIANAIDVTAFHFADGRVASIARDYGKPGAEGRFLEQAHAAACRVFNGVLGPGYNRLHATHYHLDMGPYWICR
jgi:hypothetical protein